MKHDEMIEVIQAHKDGKRIQLSGKHASASWFDTDCPGFSFGEYDYRVKPEPRKILKVDCKLAGLVGTTCGNCTGGFCKVVKFLEVIE